MRTHPLHFNVARTLVRLLSLLPAAYLTRFDAILDAFLDHHVVSIATFITACKKIEDALAVGKRKYRGRDNTIAVESQMGVGAAILVTLNSSKETT